MEPIYSYATNKQLLRKHKEIYSLFRDGLIHCDGHPVNGYIRVAYKGTPTFDLVFVSPDHLLLETADGTAEQGRLL